jgi:hypothetical protein
VAEGVVKEVVHHLFEAIEVAFDVGVALGAHLDSTPVSSERNTNTSRTCSSNSFRLRSSSRICTWPLSMRKIKQLFDQAEDAVRFGVDDAGRALYAGGVVDGAVEHGLTESADRGEGGFQLVGDVGEEVA